MIIIIDEKNKDRISLINNVIITCMIGKTDTKKLTLFKT